MKCAGSSHLSKYSGLNHYVTCVSRGWLEISLEDSCFATHLQNLDFPLIVGGICHDLSLDEKYGNKVIL